MRKIYALMYLLLLPLFSVRAEKLCEYISDSGHRFYYINNREGEDVIDDDVISFVNSQGVFVVLNTKSKDYNEKEMVNEARRMFGDSIVALYIKNYAYMWETFPQYKYTYEEIYSIVNKFATTMTFTGYCGYEFEVEVSLDIRSILTSELCRKRIEKYPYFLGYLYKR